MHQGRRFNIQTSRACTAPDKLAGHILIFHYLLRCHPTGRHPRCHFGAFTAHLGCRCCPGEQPGQPRRFLGGDDCQPVISCTAPSVFREITVCLVTRRDPPELRGIVQAPQQRNSGSPNVASKPRYGLEPGGGSSQLPHSACGSAHHAHDGVFGSCTVSRQKSFRTARII